MEKAFERWVALGGALILETALEVCKGCEHSLATCPYEMAVADCPKVRDAVLKMLRGDPEEDDVVAESMSCPLTIQVGAEQNSKKAETNNIINLRAKESDASLMSKQCPICKSPMRRSGKIKQKNPLTNRIRMVQVYYCNRCGYRTLG